MHRLGEPKFEIGGYWCRTGITGRGYATEAVRSIATFAFDVVLGAKRVEIRCDPLNRPSARVAKLAGFRLEDELLNDATGPDGTLRNTLVFSTIPSHPNGPLVIPRLARSGRARPPMRERRGVRPVSPMSSRDGEDHVPTCSGSRTSPGQRVMGQKRRGEAVSHVLRYLASVGTLGKEGWEEAASAGAGVVSETVRLWDRHAL